MLQRSQLHLLGRYGLNDVNTSCDLLPGGLDQAIKHLSERIRRNPKDNFLEDLAQLGRLRQASMSNHRRSGAVFTPYAIAEEIVKFVDLRNGDTVCDPAVGPGVFLLAAAERKMQLGESVSSICSTLRGVDSVSYTHLTLPTKA